MSYRTNKNYTLIDELPDLEDLERGGGNQNGGGINMIPPDNATQIQKFIRNNVYDPPIESGMSQLQRQQQRQRQQPPIQEQPQNTQFIPQQPSPQNQFIEDPIMLYELNNQEQAMYRPIHHLSYDINCVNVADHTTNCVVCSRLYQQNTSGYIVAIILLAIICILLLKRVLNV
jgi:hypothetical protein